MKPHETAFPCEPPRLSFRMADPSCTEGMVTYWPHSAAVTEAEACGGPCQGMHEGLNGGGRKAGSQSQEKQLFRFAIFSKEIGNAVGTLECSSATEGNDSTKTMRIELAGQHDSESYLEEALRFANTAASLSTERFGAQGGMPMRSQVLEAMNQENM